MKPAATAVGGEGGGEGRRLATATITKEKKTKQNRTKNRERLSIDIGASKQASKHSKDKSLGHGGGVEGGKAFTPT
jgi:hypothetical protein